MLNRGIMCLATLISAQIQADLNAFVKIHNPELVVHTLEIHPVYKDDLN